MKILLIEDQFYQNFCSDLNSNLLKVSHSKKEMINQAVEDLLSGGGKKLRPFLMFLAASFGNYKKEDLIQVGTAIELLHMASLIHDDLIDDAELRRGKETAHKKFGRKEAVFIGDYLLSQTFDIFFEYLEKENLIRVNKSVRLLCEGEIEESEKNLDFKISLKDYYRRIRHKTALLFALSSYLGAYLGGLRNKNLNLLYKLGLEIGMAFQIRDDILDFDGDKNQIGKNLYQDLHEGIITLPLILLLNKKEYQNKYFNKENFLEAKIISEPIKLELIEDVEQSGVLAESYDILKIFINRVENYLSQLPEDQNKKRLEKFIKFQVKRDF